MKFAVYWPPKAKTGKSPEPYWLSAFTGQNRILKSGQHQAASEHGLFAIAPDIHPCVRNIKGEG